MVIAINAIFFQKNVAEGYGHYAWEITKRLIIAHPEHEFVLVFDRPFDEAFIVAPNVRGLVVKPAACHPLSFFYWYNVAAPAALRQFKPSVWVQPYGFCSLRTKIKQVLVVHDLAYIHFPQGIGKLNLLYYKMFTGRFLYAADRLITVSNFSKADIEQQFPSLQKNIAVVSGAARSIFQPLSWESKQIIKEKYTNGQEYFLCTGGISPRKNMINILKAFSLFKKWHKTNMKLVFCGRLAWQYQDFLEKLKTYKYRNDVVLTGYLPDAELAALTGSAYACVYMSLWEGFGLPVVEAMQSGVAVIGSNNSSIPEIGKTAVSYANPYDPQDIASQMQLLYKSETIRQQRIDAGIAEAAKYSWDKAAQQFWDEIMHTVKD